MICGSDNSELVGQEARARAGDDPAGFLDDIHLAIRRR